LSYQITEDLFRETEIGGLVVASTFLSPEVVRNNINSHNEFFIYNIVGCPDEIFGDQELKLLGQLDIIIFKIS